ncbi:zinc finger protein 280C isoform X3 [Bos javanicus]|uniref:zinc finger protein 280C isoform X3 n=1 Tax=Bos javanicus TaxID=9906 RepID=UPI002AA84580|nr:zinc finger protein 280C isoform X3 [Bos javanicus]XP_061263909.1 zinc finger protein 280C isoform X3 [Bos javanicus]XP_061263910.1 zinc finger protein 280C isoform X3 [Bos javanicus]XP_061263911.1 zinc finger protein 280C isoform X3 [Bos javanicus]XP_061263912.1 zinc finger protein 280C isoform X3 [Bos javanicus]
MDDDTSFQPKDSSKMAELFMECEEEELEPWQKKVETPQEEDDELIFVGAVPGSKSPTSSELDEDSSSPEAAFPRFHPESQSSSPEAAFPRFHPESRSSYNSDMAQNVSKPDFAKNSSQVGLDESSDLPFSWSQNTVPLSQDGSTIYIEGLDETLPKIKHSDIIKIITVNPKTSESVSEINPCASLSLTNCSSATSSYLMWSKGTHTLSTATRTGTFFVRACPKCNVQFNLLDPLKYHMKVCCPDMVDVFMEMIKVELSNIEQNTTGAETGKLIMLVSDFYYGRHEGNFDDDEKTYTTFKCFSCLKVLKNNIRFMNHMKHHLELEKQNTESWENHTTCQHCYRQYPTPFQLQCHIESTHTPLEFSTICKICELSFDTEHILLQHMKDTHKPGEMPYICQVCQFRSSSFTDVETHFRVSHENTKNLLCPFCLKVSRMATPYMNHYMKHQKKGIHRCSQCRLQFLTYKEKLVHKLEHRTFIKPKELEGLPPGTKVTIRASIESLHSGPSTSKSILSSSTSSSTCLQVSPSTSKTTTTGSSPRSNANEYKTRKFSATTSTESKPSTSKERAAKCRAKTSYKPKKKRNRRNKISVALKNLRCRGVYTCIECHTKIKDFASHFSLFTRCNFCKYSTNCNKAFVNHMLSSHTSQPAKRVSIFKKRCRTLRGITLVCLKCDFLADSSTLDRMAKHLSQRKTHTCQVIIETLPEGTSAVNPFLPSC